METNRPQNSATIALLKCVMALAALVAALCSKAAAGDSDIYSPSFWRLGFFWSLATREYPPSRVPWDAYSHIAQFAIQPSSACGIDQSKYKPYLALPELIHEAHSRKRKVLITLLHDDQARYLNHCTSAPEITQFVGAISKYVQQHEFDGIDVDWEANIIPDNYRRLIHEIRRQLPDIIVTVDIAVHQRHYVASIQHLIDRINLMSYDLNTTDYSGDRLNSVWHNAATRRPDAFSKLKSSEENLEYLRSAGISNSKILLGIPFYGYALQACNIAESKTLKVCDEALRPGELFRAGSERWTQISFAQMTTSCLSTSRAHWDASSESSYFVYTPQSFIKDDKLCSNPSFVTIATPRQMDAIAKLVRERELGGIMAFALHQEYSQSNAGEPQYPLTDALLSSLTRYGAKVASRVWQQAPQLEHMHR